MDREKSNAPPPWLSVPQFGDWDQKGGVPDYSRDFSKIREMRKQNKRELSRASLGNEEEFVSADAAKDKKKADCTDDTINPFHKETSPTKSKCRSWNCFSCCIKG